MEVLLGLHMRRISRINREVNFNHKETQETQKRDEITTHEIIVFLARSVSEGDKKYKYNYAAKKTKKTKRNAIEVRVERLSIGNSPPLCYFCFLCGKKFSCLFCGFCVSLWFSLLRAAP